MFHLCTEYYVQRADPQCVNVAASGKIASVEDGRLETDVHSMSVDHREVLRVPSVWTVPNLTRYYVSFSTVLVPQLQFCHLPWLVSVQFAGDLYSRVP